MAPVQEALTKVVNSSALIRSSSWSEQRGRLLRWSRDPDERAGFYLL